MTDPRPPATPHSPSQLSRPTVPAPRREFGRPQVLDPVLVSEMLAGIAPSEVVRDYLATYRALLPGRVAAVQGAVGGQDDERLVDRLLSLRVSAQMAGAEQLAELAEHLEEGHRLGDQDAVTRALADLPDAADRLEQAITELLGDGPA